MGRLKQMVGTHTHSPRAQGTVQKRSHPPLPEQGMERKTSMAGPRYPGERSPVMPQGPRCAGRKRVEFVAKLLK